MSSVLSRFADKVLSDDPLIRRMNYRAVLSAFGDGAFTTGSAVYFTQIVGLTAAQVGIGLTVAGIATFLFAVPAGRLVDRVGDRRTWLSGTILIAIGFACWPFVTNFAGYLLITVVIELMQTWQRSGGGAYRLSIFAPGQRVRGNAFQRAYRNVGYTLGALAGGIALAVPGDLLVKGLPLFTAFITVIDAVLISRMPATKEKHVDEPLEDAVEHAHEPRSALHNRGFVLTTFLDGVLGTHQVLLNTVIPLWLVTETDAPRVLLAWLFGTNTVMAVLLQVAAAKGVTDVRTAVRSEWRGAACFVVSCGIILVTHNTVGWVTIALVWIGHVTVTGAELFESAGSWGFQSELTDPSRRGEYQGVAQLGRTAGTVWAPALYTFLAMNWGTPGWLVIAAIVIAAAIALGPAARLGERFAAHYFPEPVA